MSQKIVIATRKSRLALWQAQMVQHRLLKLYPHLSVELLPLSTKGDEILDRSLAKIGGKGLFIKELESVLQDGQADIAVHSLKDVPMELPTGFSIAARFARDMPEDAWVSPNFASLAHLPEGSVVGTSSLRRQAIILKHFPHLQIQPLRGNLDTRLQKLDQQAFAGIILARAGLARLNYGQRITQVLDPQTFVPSPGQGALAIETLTSRVDMIELMTPLNESIVALATTAERFVSLRLGGSCQVPIGAYASWVEPNIMNLHVLLSLPDGSSMLQVQQQRQVAHEADAIDLAKHVVNDLFAQGGEAILAQIQADEKSIK